MSLQLILKIMEIYRNGALIKYTIMSIVNKFSTNVNNKQKIEDLKSQLCSIFILYIVYFSLNKIIDSTRHVQNLCSKYILYTKFSHSFTYV